MDSLFTDAQKAAYQSNIDLVHGTWARPLTVFRHAERVVLSEDPNFIFPYGDNQPNTNTAYNISSGVINARIWYMPGIAGNQEMLTSSTSDREFTARGEPQIRFRNDKNYVRLKLDTSGYNFIKGADTVEIDDNNYNVFTAFRQGGLFLPEYFTVWLEQNS